MLLSLKGCSTSHARTFGGACPLGPAASKIAYAAPSPTWPGEFRTNAAIGGVENPCSFEIWNAEHDLVAQGNACKNQNGQLMETPWKRSLSRRRKVQWLVCNMSMPQKRLAQTSDFFCCNDRQKWWTFDSTSLINRNLHQLLWQTPPICIICAVFYLSKIGAGFCPSTKKWRKWNLFPNHARSTGTSGTVVPLVPSSVCSYPVLDFCFGSSAIFHLFSWLENHVSTVLLPPKSSGRPRNIWEWMSLNKARLAAYINCTNPPW